ncbi:unnamed protein product [Closterium sp. NIES-65]|nr:unnamed protein product [Closterium sp. NIES-65]
MKLHCHATFWQSAESRGAVVVAAAPHNMLSRTRGERTGRGLCFSGASQAATRRGSRREQRQQLEERKEEERKQQRQWTDSLEHGQQQGGAARGSRRGAGVAVQRAERGMWRGMAWIGRGVDAGWTRSGRGVDAEWTRGGRGVDAEWTRSGRGTRNSLEQKAWRRSGRAAKGTCEWIGMHGTCIAGADEGRPGAARLNCLLPFLLPCRCSFTSSPSHPLASPLARASLPFLPLLDILPPLPSSTQGGVAVATATQGNCRIMARTQAKSSNFYSEPVLWAAAEAAAAVVPAAVVPAAAVEG